MRSNVQHQESPDGFEAPRPSELLQPLILIWPAEHRGEVAQIADYLYRIAAEQPEIIAKLAPLRDPAAIGQVRAMIATRPDLFAAEFPTMRGILTEALRMEGSGEWAASI